MAHHHADRPVRITGEQRLHPALRTLGRACIALARWQREQQQRPPETPPGDTTPSASPGTHSATMAPTTPAQESHHD
ncbi:MAG: hypothetical protein LC799_35185 [Actinobacteria bacterium]|nr:hypothetical protein [Actinomycetota bacterium]